MNKNFLLRFLITILFVSFLFTPELFAADLKPVAASVKRKHDLNVTFRSYNLFQDAHEINESSLIEALSSGTTAEILPGKLAGLLQQKPDAIAIDIPFNNGTITVELVSTNIFTEDFSIVTGENKTMPYTSGAYYSGIIKDKPNSLASFSFFNDELYGVISDNENGNIVVGRIARPENLIEYVIYSDQKLNQPFTNFCNTSESPSQEESIRNPQVIVSPNTTKCVRLYYEVDNDIYINKGSNVVNTVNWMTAVHNNVQTLYANDNITVALSQIYVWTSNDPFTGTNSSAQLATFRSTRTSFNGDVAQLVAHDANNGGVAATINGLCLSTKYSYADVNYTYSNVLTYSWTVEVIAHEFGHVLGSRHTHNCSWPGGAIDNCGPNAGYPTEGGCANGPTPANGGTIMSYCHLTGVGINFSNGFGPFPAAAIQTAVNNASCLGTSCAACPLPAHNECSSPAPLSVTTNCVYNSASFCAATQSMAPITCNSRTAAHSYDVWYSVTPSQTSMIINCQSGTLTDVVMGLYSGSCGNLALVSCADATTAGGLETINATSLVSGNTYYIRVYDFNGATTGADFAICISQSCIAAANNSCGNASSLNIGTSCNYINGDLCSSTQSIAPSTCSNYTAQTALDVWYTITPAQNNVRITSISGVNTDVVLGVYSGVCGSLNLIKCIDSTSNGGIEILNVGVTIGNTYYIRVYDWGGNQFGTDFQLCVQYLCAPPNAPTGATAVNPTICGSGSTALNVTGSLSAGATWKWYTNSCGGTAAGTGASITVSPVSTTTYYVRAENGNCFSVCQTVSVSVINVLAPATTNSSPSSICSGSSSTLSVSGTLSVGATWHWYSNSCGGNVVGTGSSVSVSPAANTTFYVRAENGNCFSACLPASLEVIDIPSNPISASAFPPTVCGGSNSTLSVTGTLSPGATWEWYTGSCGGNSVGSGITETVSPSSTRTYYVRAENGNCHSTCETITVDVSQSPADPSSANTSFALICEGDFSTLSVSGSLTSGATWQWYSGSCGGNLEGTGTSLNVSPSATIQYFVRAESGNCFSDCENTSITVLPAPGIPQPLSPSSTMLCEGESAVLTENGTLTSGSDWYWYTGSCGGTLIGQGTSISISPLTNQTYYVRSENINCQSGCVNTTINVNPPPVSPTIALANDTLYIQSFSGYEWFWSSDNIIFNFSGNDQLLPITKNGYYFVVVTDVNGCSASSDTIHYTTTDLNQLFSNNEIVVYPNPFNDQLNIELNSAINEDVEIKIFDSTGRLIYNDRLHKNKSNVISLSQHADGIYQLLFSVRGKILTQKVLKH